MIISAISLGCDKNRVDTENMLFLLQRAGHTLTHKADESDVILINTCAFIESAKKEAIQTIVDMLPYHADGKRLIVTGCMAERYAEELKKGFPEVEAIVGINSENDIAAIVDRRFQGEIYKKKEPRGYVNGRVLTTPAHYAYLKIADGCDNKCTYCAIPSIRGAYRSVPMDNLIKEAEGLVRRGVKEIILVAQDTTCYGKDLYGKPRLKELLAELIKLPVWKIRLMYAYPQLIDDGLINMISKEEKIAKYLDIPLQHIDDALLKRMGRKCTENDIRTLLKNIKRTDPEISVRSSFIVGFNGESAEAYNKLKSFLTETEELDYAGLFGYSPEEGTPAARFKEKNLPKKLINERVDELEKIWSERIVKNNEKYLGRTLEVIYEDINYKEKRFEGRIEQNAPGIDTKVLFSSHIPLDIGKVYRVKIESVGFNLYGSLAGDGICAES